jgi:hypothetical protein
MITMSQKPPPLKEALTAYLEALKKGQPVPDADFSSLKAAFDTNREELRRHICRVTPPRLVIDNTPEKIR